MKTPTPPSHSLEALRELTPARVGLGRSGAGLPTDALLAFTLDHARARDAVHAGFDTEALMAGLRELGLSPVGLSSRAAEDASRSERDARNLLAQLGVARVPVGVGRPLPQDHCLEHRFLLPSSPRSLTGWNQG